MDGIASTAEFQLVGGALCLDFVNSVEPRLGRVRHDNINNYADILTWSVQAGTLSKRTDHRLRRVAKQHPEQAHAVFAQAIELREALYRILTAGLKTKPAQVADLAVRFDKRFSLIIPEVQYGDLALKALGGHLTVVDEFQ